MPHARQKAQHLRTGILLRRTAQDRRYVKIAVSNSDILEVDTLKHALALTVTTILIQRHAEQAEEPACLYGFVVRHFTSEWHSYHTISRNPSYPSTLDNGLEYDISRHAKDRSLRIDHMALVFDLQDGEQGVVMTFHMQLERLERPKYAEISSSDWVGAITFGFDFGFNPVCMIYGFDSKYFQHMKVVPEHDLFAWTMMNCRAISQQVAAMGGLGVSESWLQFGDCVLVGDRKTGLSAHLHMVNLHIEIKKGWMGARRRAWIVDIGAIDLPSSFIDYEEMNRELDAIVSQSAHPETTG